MNVQPSETSVRYVRRARKTEHVSDDAIREAMATAVYVGRAAAIVGLTERQMWNRVRRLGLARAGRGRPKGTRPVVPCETIGASCEGRGGDRCWGGTK